MGNFFRTNLLVLVAAVGLSGCASFDLIKPPPTQSQTIAVEYTNQGASSWSDLPIGVYQVPDSQIYISGYQAGGIGGLFGVAGILVQSEVEKGVGSSRVSNVRNALHLDLASQAREMTASLIASGQFGKSFSADGLGGAPTLSVAPFIVITYVDDTNVRPYVILKATLSARGTNGATWTSRYIASMGKPIPLEGGESYTANDGALLKDTTSQELRAAIQFMLADLASPRPRETGKPLRVETDVPYVRGKFKFDGYQIGEDDRWIAFVPKVADANVFAGVHVLDKSAIVYGAPAGKDN